MLRWTLFSCLSFYTQRISTPLSPFTLNVLLLCFRFVSKLIFYYRSFHFYCTTISLATELPLSCPIIDTHSLGLLTIIVGGGVTTMVRRGLCYIGFGFGFVCSQPAALHTGLLVSNVMHLFHYFEWRLKAREQEQQLRATHWQKLNHIQDLCSHRLLHCVRWTINRDGVLKALSKLSQWIQLFSLI